MKTEYKHLVFKPKEQKPKTQVWTIYNKSGEELGQVKWYIPWRQYCSILEIGQGYSSYLVFSQSCHLDIADFIRQLMDMRKNKT